MGNMKSAGHAEVNGAKGSKKKNNKLKQQKHRSLSHGSSLSMNDSIANIDWTEVFNHFDHRRFVTFGIIHGL